MTYLLPYSEKLIKALSPRRNHTMAEQPPIHTTSRLFSELANILSQKYLAPSAEDVSVALNDSLQQLEGYAAHHELLMPRSILHELAEQVDGFLAKFDGIGSEVPSLDELRQAQREDELARKAMNTAMLRRGLPIFTPQSLRRAEELIAQGEQRAIVAIATRIANKELISSGELQRRLGIGRQSISEAVKSGRLFAIIGPGGENFYPAYYADPTLDRRTLEKVSRVLGSLPAASKDYFFTSKSESLQATPLDALRQGKKAKVFAAAESFVQC
jgi:hypothetical protein